MFNDLNQREYNIGEILIHTWSVFIRHSNLFVLTMLLFYIPISVSGLFLGKYSDDIVSDSNEDITGYLNYFGVYIILTVILGPIANMIITRITQKEVQKGNTLEEINYSGVVKTVFGNYGKIFTTGLLAGLIIIGLSILLIVPGVIWSVYYAFLIQAVTIKGLFSKSALNYSKSLVKGRWWKIFILPLLFGSINIMFAFFLLGIGSLLPEFIQILIKVFSQVVVGSFVSTLLPIAFTIYFLNLDSIKGNKQEVIS